MNLAIGMVGNVRFSNNNETKQISTGERQQEKKEFEINGAQMIHQDDNNVY